MTTKFYAKLPALVGLLTRQLLLLVSLLLAVLAAQAQTGGALKGRVTDESQNPLPGVTVTLKGTTTGAITDAEGRYTFPTAVTNGTLVFSFIGYTPKEVAINNRTTVDVSLAPDAKALSEVVVVGYGTQRKIETTGAIASVKAEELTQTPVVNVAQGLQARVAGVQVTQNSAAPGGNISVRVRGTNSINGSSEPLYVVDGVPISNSGGVNDISSLSTINPNDIASVEVLKDASATAIYGARGANGVVLITTKRGKAGATRVTYEGYYGVQQITKKMDLLDAGQFATLENEIYKTSLFPDPASLGKGVDWQDLIFRQAPIQSHQLSISGGSEKTQLALSANYFNQDGIVISSDFKRYSLRLNLDHAISNRVKTGVSFLGSYTINNSIPTGSTSMDGPAVTTSILGAALGAPPTMQPYREDGSIFPFTDQFNGRYREVTNPLGLAAILNRDAINRSITNIYGEVSLLKGLTYRASFNAILQSSLGDNYSPLSILGQGDINANSGSAGKTNSNTTVLLHESIVTYARTLAEKHSFKFTGVVSSQANLNNSNSISANGFPNDATLNESIQLATNRTVNSSRSKERLDSYMARFNYGFRDKYFFDVTARADGASKFGANHKYGFFPSAAASWRVMEESFMQNMTFISDLKLRASYGVTGNAGAISAYQSLATVGSGAGYSFNHIYMFGISPSRIPNPDLRWEKSTQADIGLDVSFWDNRLNLVVDVYKKRTDDLLYVQSLPLSSGYSSITGNFAGLENKGIEVATNMVVLDGPVQWDISGNISANRNKVLSLDGGTTQERFVSSYTVLKVGEPLGLFKTYVFDGIYQSGDAIIPGSDGRVGGVKVKDLNNDGTITADDQTVTGNPNPDFIYGFSTNLRYKKFDLSAFFSGSHGNDIYNLSRYTFENPLGARNVLAALADRWSPTNPSNEYVSGLQGGRNPVSDRFVEDGSYFRCKNLTLGYTFPSYKFISNTRLYVSANNLFTLTDYSGFDPEVNSFGNSNTLIGIDNLVYPAARSFIGGIQLTF
ncbi:SusC/RagA family TonB-linked outer membrane protein [Adhaeribacter aerolatus]|uniref:SusC/RagA family TonB-linked outer membrane protein n=1 Tax=Adhaeribacter aerolatus TaxID=670289 RepID=A0A512AV44_9BACT|nr:TonB-dependent receptor [Adhaeribacter aerolatus]GEO03584.1 SusC/RagA family TonB-linked outer membrane protein [Adhaeribacter aerolatus]